LFSTVQLCRAIQAAPTRRPALASVSLSQALRNELSLENLRSFYNVGLLTTLLQITQFRLRIDLIKIPSVLFKLFCGNGLALSDTEACEAFSAGAACIAGKKKFVTKPGIFSQS